MRVTELTTGPQTLLDGLVPDGAGGGIERLLLRV